MAEIIDVPFSENLIRFTAEQLMADTPDSYDFSSDAVVFSHHRPGLYLHKSMAQALCHPFFPPQIFSMDDFMLYLSAGDNTPPPLSRGDNTPLPLSRGDNTPLPLSRGDDMPSPFPGDEAAKTKETAIVTPMDSIYLLFQVICSLPDNTWGRELSLTRFIPWGLKLEQVISELDIEMVSDESLKSIDLEAAYRGAASLSGDDRGTMSQDNICRHLVLIRQGYHAMLKSRNLTTRALTYCSVANNVSLLPLSRFKQIYLVGLFAMTQAEKIVVQHLLRQTGVTLIRQTDGNKWTPFEEMDEWEGGVGSRQSAVGSQGGEVGSRQSAVGSQGGEVGSRQSAVGSRGEGVGSRQSAVSSQGGEVGSHSDRSADCLLPPEIFLYRAFNTHSEVVALRDVLVQGEAASVKADPCACPHGDSQQRSINSQKTESSAFSLQPTAYSLQPSAFSLQPSAFSPNTAIVLPSSEALIPLLSEVMTALPVDYNISMGYPVIRTPVYALLDVFMRLYRNRREATLAEGVDTAYYLEDYLNLLMHPYIKNIRHATDENAENTSAGEASSSRMRILVHMVENVLIRQEKRFLTLGEIEQNSRIFESASMMSPGVSPQEFKEMLVDIHNLFIRGMDEIQTLRQMADFFEGILTLLLRRSPAPHYPFSGEFFHKLFGFIDELKDSLISREYFEHTSDLLEVFTYLVKGEQVYFEGSPVKGLQILGLLETRCLKFDKVFILDVNEGVLPDVEIFCPFLPLPVRQALRMPTYHQREEIARYHFRRLAASSREIHIIYQETERMQRSRFVEELVWEKEKMSGSMDILKPVPTTLNISLTASCRFRVDKTPEMLEILRTMDFSPSSLNTYLQCPAKFFFSRVLRLKEKEGIADEIDASERGNILHCIMEALYRPLIGQERIRYDWLEDNLRRLLDEVFRQRFGENLYGEPYLLREMMFKRLKNYLGWEKEQFVDARRVISVESNLSLKLGVADIRLSGRIDRIDQQGNEYRIIDYKSGGMDKQGFKCFERVLTSREEMKKEIASLQLPCYVLLFHGANPDISYERINSSIISLRAAKDREEMLFDDDQLNRDTFLGNIFLPTLKNLACEIIDRDVPFMANDDDEGNGGCRDCAFPVLCRR